jgi:hypothetical protein
MKINLHIERLVLDGLPFESGDRAKLQAAIQTELARLLADQPHLAAWGSGGAASSLRSNDIRFSPQNSPAQLGGQIAGSIFGGLNKGR